MNNLFKTYHYLLLVSLLVLTLISCEKQAQPVPVFNQSEIDIMEGAAIKQGSSINKGGNKSLDDVVGGDDNEDDDGGGVFDGGDDVPLGDSGLSPVSV